MSYNHHIIGGHHSEMMDRFSGKPSEYALKLWDMVDTCSIQCPERLSWNADGDGFSFSSTRAATEPCDVFGSLSIVDFFFPGPGEEVGDDGIDAQRRRWEKLARQFNNYKIDDDGSQGLKRRHPHGLFRRGRKNLAYYLIRSSAVSGTTSTEQTAWQKK